MKNPETEKPLKKQNSNFKLLMLDDSSHNTDLIEKMLRKEKIGFISKNVKFEDNFVDTRVLDGKVVTAQNIFKEATESNNAAMETLNRQEAYFKALVEHGTYIKTLLTPEGKLSYISPSVKSILGFRQEECINKTLYEMMHPEDVQKMMETMGKLIHSPRKSFYFQQRMHHKNGSYRWFEGTITNLLDEPEVKAIVLNIRDISERSKKDETLRDTEKFYRIVTDIPFIGIVWMGIDNKILNANKSLCQMLGYTVNELKNLSVKDITHPGDIEKDRSELIKMLIGETDTFLVKKRYIAKNKKVVWGNLNMSCSRDNNGKVQYLIGIIEKIDSKKQVKNSAKYGKKQLDNTTYTTSAVSEGKRYFKHKGFIRTFAGNVRKYRLKRGMSQEYLAQEIGIPVNQIGRIERSEVNTSVSAAYALSATLRVSLHQLFC